MSNLYKNGRKGKGGVIERENNESIKKTEKMKRIKERQRELDREFKTFFFF
jgi:hypothetical protein